MARRCGPRHVKHCNPWHAQLVTEYRDARDAVEALRESGQLVTAGGTAVAMYQLERGDFDQLHPVPTFKEWLQAHRRSA